MSSRHILYGIECISIIPKNSSTVKCCKNHQDPSRQSLKPIHNLTRKVYECTIKALALREKTVRTPQVRDQTMSVSM